MTKKLKVGTLTYRVVFSSWTQSAHGETDLDSKEIHINTRWDKDSQQATLLHEILHVALKDCSLFEHPINDAEKQEEAIVRFMEPGIMQILTDNKWAKEFIFG